MDALEAAGRPVWLRLGDRDLAMCLIRTELLTAGARLTEAHAAVVVAMGVEARVLSVADDPVRRQSAATHHGADRQPDQSQCHQSPEDPG